MINGYVKLVFEKCELPKKQRMFYHLFKNVQAKMLLFQKRRQIASASASCFLHPILIKKNYLFEKIIYIQLKYCLIYAVHIFRAIAKMADDQDKDQAVDIPEFESLPLKKKKKKKKPLNLDDLEKALTDSTNPQDNSTGSGDVSASMQDANAQEGAMETNENDNIGDDLNFDFAKKKKKKKKVITFEEENERLGDENAGECLDDIGQAGENDDGIKIEGSNWLGTDRDYTYDELIDHVFSIIRANNPELNAGEKKRFVLKPPTVLRVGTKKTSFANFLEICKLVHRQPKHMQAFLLAELGTSGSVDAANQLIIKGRFQQVQIENVLRRYIKEYVACQTCRSPNTILQKETRLFFLQCEKCGSRRSVSSIKSGFQAVTSKRAAIRAKTN